MTSYNLSPIWPNRTEGRSFGEQLRRRSLRAATPCRYHIHLDPSSPLVALLTGIKPVVLVHEALIRTLRPHNHDRLGDDPPNVAL